MWRKLVIQQETATSRRSRRQWMSPPAGNSVAKQAQVQVVVGHLVGDAQGAGVQLAELLQVPLRHAAARRHGPGGRRRRWPSLRHQDAGQRVEGLAAQAQLAGPEDLRVAGQDLLDQRGARARQADDEHGPLAVEAEAANALEEVGRKGGQQAIDKPRVVRGIVPPAALRAFARQRALPCAHGPRPVQNRPGHRGPGPGQRGEPSAGPPVTLGLVSNWRITCSVGLGQLAAQQRCELGIGAGVVRIVPQRLAEAGLGFVEAAQLF